jgi:hypothetical protein
MTDEEYVRKVGAGIKRVGKVRDMTQYGERRP